MSPLDREFFFPHLPMTLPKNFHVANLASFLVIYFPAVHIITDELNIVNSMQTF